MQIDAASAVSCSRKHFASLVLASSLFPATPLGFLTTEEVSDIACNPCGQGQLEGAVIIALPLFASVVQKMESTRMVGDPEPWHGMFDSVVASTLWLRLENDCRLNDAR